MSVTSGTRKNKPSSKKEKKNPSLKQDIDNPGKMAAHNITDDDIRFHAYQIFELRNIFQLEGTEQEDWYMAESMLKKPTETQSIT